MSIDVAAIERTTMRKVFWRIIPFLMLCYLLNYVDRVNIGFASLQMNKELGLTAAQFGFAASIFFVAYFLFEVPSNLALEKFGARRWIATIMIAWGAVGTAMAFVSGAPSLYVMRFLIGAAEAGFFPGVLLYMTYWFPREHRARIVSLFMIAIPLSNVVGSPLSGFLLNADGLLGLRGWQLLFILESAPAILLGAATLLILVDRPSNVKWLSSEQRSWLVEKLASEKAQARPIGHMSALKVFTNRYILTLALAVGASAATSAALSIWQPQIIKAFGLSHLEVGLLNSVPFIVACLGMVMWGRHSDATLERKWHTVGPLFLTAISFALTLVTHSLAPTILILSLALAGTYAMKGPVWALSTEWLSPATAAAGIAAINALGNLWGSVIIWSIGAIKDATGSFALGLLPLVALNAVGGLAVLWISFQQKRDRGASQ